MSASDPGCLCNCHSAALRAVMPDLKEHATCGECKLALAIEAKEFAESELELARQRITQLKSELDARDGDRRKTVSAGDALVNAIAKLELQKQTLVDCCFSLAMHAAKSMHGRSTEDIAKWVAGQLDACGFNTVPMGCSWGVLTRPVNAGLAAIRGEGRP